MPGKTRPSHFRCVSLDLEVGKGDSRIHAFAGVRADTGRRFVFTGGNLATALAKLDDLANGASFVLGHNLIAFDLPHLSAAKPDLRLLKLPTIDTLRLSPLVFPRNPYHHLVKHYQDAGLKRGQLNDPYLDARLALEVFDDQRRALREAAPDLLAAWHWLSTPEPEGKDRALDNFFFELRGSRRPSDTEALAVIGKRLAGIACATHGRQVTAEAATSGWALAYALAWLSVAGGNSVISPWVRHQFPEASRLVSRLRDTACADPACAWCRERHDARRRVVLPVPGGPLIAAIPLSSSSAEPVLDTLRTKFATLVENMANRLTVGSGGKPKVFKDSSLHTLEEWLELFESRNVLQDTALREQVEQARALLHGTSDSRYTGLEILALGSVLFFRA